MHKPFLAAGSIALALVISPVVAQQSPSPDQPTAQQIDPSLVGLPVFSSDGLKLGQVAEVGVSGGEPVVRAELGDFLGIGATSVVIGADVFEKKADRIQIAMTAEEIKDTISKQRKEPKPQ